MIFPRYGMLAIPVGGAAILFVETLLAQWLISHEIPSQTPALAGEMPVESASVLLKNL